MLQEPVPKKDLNITNIDWYNVKGSNAGQNAEKYSAKTPKNITVEVA